MGGRGVERLSHLELRPEQHQGPGCRLCTPEGGGPRQRHRSIHEQERRLFEWRVRLSGPVRRLPRVIRRQELGARSGQVRVEVRQHRERALAHSSPSPELLHCGVSGRNLPVGKE